MLTVDEALARVLAAVEPLAGETVPLTDAECRVLAEDLTSARTLPPFDNAQMDGYAARAVDLAGAAPGRGVVLRVTQAIFAGGRPAGPVGPGEAARITTGAPIPPGADSVVMQEQARAEGDRVELCHAPRPGEYVRPAGEDVRRGEVALLRGTPLGPAEIALLAALGRAAVPVVRRPRVAVFSTGDELCAVDEDPAGRIVDSNGWAVAAQVAEAGAVPVRLGIVPDDRAAIERLIERAADCDVVASTAGVSVGERDFVKDALAARGVTLDFWRVAMRPGKPLAFGTRGRQLFFGLPGNPTSSMVSFELFVRPAVLRLQGRRDIARPRLRALLTAAMTKPKGMAMFPRARIEFIDGRPVATPLSKQGSGLMTSMVGANALLVLPTEIETAAAGSEVEAIWLETCG